MNRSAWGPGEKEEYDVLLQRVIEEADSTHERVDLMERLVTDAIQAHRWWASDCERDARRTGFAAQIKSYLKRSRVLFANREAMVDKPRVVGFKRANAEGVVYDVQALLETATFDELRDKRREAIRSIKSYSDSIALLDRLLFLAELHPDAATVAEALEVHGMSLDEYLGLRAA